MNITYNNINHSIRLYNFVEKKDSPVIWLLHGAGGDQSHYDTVLPPLLEKNCRIVVSDVRLHGDSQPIDKQLPTVIDNETVIEDMVYILKQLVDQYGGFKLYVAGFSLGGVMAQLFGRYYLENGVESIDLAGIVLIASCVVGLTWERIEWMVAFHNDEETEELAISIREFLKVAPLYEYGKEVSRKSTDKIESLDNLKKIIRFVSKALTPIVDKPEFLNTLNLPMLMIAPEHDLYTSGELKKLDEYNKQNGIQSEVVDIKDAGHMVPVDQGPEVGKAIARLFD